MNEASQGATVTVSPNGGDSSRAAAPAGTLLVATRRGVVRIERGAPDLAWEIAETSLADHHVGSLLRLPEAGLVFAGVHGGGLFRSADDGRTWTRAMRGLATQHEHVFCLTAQRRPTGLTLWAGTEPPALYRSDDLGETWVELPALRDVPDTEKWAFPPPPHIAHAKHVAFHPSDPRTLYVCIEQGALLKSTDDGASWTELTHYSAQDDRFYRDVHRVVMPRSDPATLYMTSGEGLYGSIDAGRTWTHLTLGTDRIGYPDALFVDPDDDHTVYIGGAGASPISWEQGRLGTANAGVLRSRDRGRTWEELDNGLPHPVRGNIEALSMHVFDEGFAFYAGTAVGEVFASEDRGATWSLIAAGLPPVSKVSHYRRFLPERVRRPLATA